MHFYNLDSKYNPTLQIHFPINDVILTGHVKHISSKPVS